jgi:hypothetical protein
MVAAPPGPSVTGSWSDRCRRARDTAGPVTRDIAGLAARRWRRWNRASLPWELRRRAVGRSKDLRRASEFERLAAAG